MHRLLLRVLLTAALSLMLSTGGGYAAARQNTVVSIELEQLDRMLAEDSGRTAIVFMAAWCMPCIEELPAVSELFEKYRPDGLRMLGLSIDFGGPDAIQPYIDLHKVRFPVYWVGEKAIKAYQIRGIPMILLVRDGKITERVVGRRSKKVLDKILAEFLK